YFDLKEMRWAISPRWDGATATDFLAEALAGNMLGIAVQQGDGGAWQELFGNAWHYAQVRLTALVVQPAGPAA
ncbi:unnamed protein product, partial [Polarella glacialis]